MISPVQKAGEIKKVEDTLLDSGRASGISVGIVDTDEIVVFAHQGEVDQWNREEEFFMPTLDAPLKKYPRGTQRVRRLGEGEEVILV